MSTSPNAHSGCSCHCALLVHCARGTSQRDVAMLDRIQPQLSIVLSLTLQAYGLPRTVYSTVHSTVSYLRGRRGSSQRDVATLDRIQPQLSIVLSNTLPASGLSRTVHSTVHSTVSYLRGRRGHLAREQDGSSH